MHRTGTKETQMHAIAFAKALAMTAIDIFNNPMTWGKVREDFRNSLAEEKRVAESNRQFPTLYKPDYQLTMPVPAFGNLGWSKMIWSDLGWIFNCLCGMRYAPWS